MLFVFVAPAASALHLCSYLRFTFRFCFLLYCSAEGVGHEYSTSILYVHHLTLCQLSGYNINILSWQT
jgi:hypothetical protein